MTCLKVVQVNEEIFNKILYDYEFKVSVEPDLFKYYYGYYEDRDRIYFNGKDELICCAYIVGNYLDKEASLWKQVRVQKVLNISATYKESISGSKAKAYMHQILKKFYTEAQIDERLRMFEADRDENLKQQHYNFPIYDTSRIVKLSNTYKFDINGAHLDALCEIFPKAKSKFVDMYNKRKTKPVFKQYPNLYVGMLAYKSKEMRKQGIPGKYERTYNWIVQRTTKMLLKAMDLVGGTPVYVNTDGFIVQDPTNLITPSKVLGEFKLEAAGDCWIYSDKNYVVYQTGLGDERELKGSCFTEVRTDIDLSKGQVVHYNIKNHTNESGQVLFRKPENITKECIKINEI